MIRRLAALALAAGTFAVVLPASAAPSIPPDPSARGYIGLCDGQGHNVTGGLLSTAPFIWKAIASTPAPLAFRGPGENAVLNAYQVRPGVDAGDWSGDQLTAAAFYHNAKVPAVQATNADLSFGAFVKEFPPQGQGLYELRMFYGKLDYGTYSATYPATFLQVAGGRWWVVRGGTVDCSVASAVSMEVAAGTQPKRQIPRVPPQEQITDAKPGTPVSTTAPRHTATPVKRGDASVAASASSAASATTSSAGAPSHATSSSGVGIGIGAAAVAVTALGALWWWRTRAPR